MSEKRILILCVSLLTAFVALLCRLFWIGTDSTYTSNVQQQTNYEVSLPISRGDFYDKNMRKLTGTQKQWYALCIPGSVGYTEMFPYVEDKQQERLYDLRNSSKPFLIQVTADLSPLGIPVYASPTRYLTVPIAVHLIGYLDGEKHGVVGLERAYDDILFRSGDGETVLCQTTAQGMLRAGEVPVVRQESRGTEAGIQLTLDVDIQRACEGIARLQMERGCIVVMEVKTGKICCSVSVPDYDPDNVIAALQADDTSFINRPLAAFDAGSVFKVVLAAAAYEQGLSWFTHDCTGAVTVAGQQYHCALNRVHGELNLRGALEESCNCYFIALGEVLGSDKIIEMAERFGFGREISLAPGVISVPGTLPDSETLENPGQQAMLCFGQGKLTVTPLQIAAMMNTIANDGMYVAPTVVEGVIEQKSLKLITLTQDSEPNRILDKSVAKILRDMMIGVIEEGIGDGAEPNEGGAGGKTGTAQTGQYNGKGEELLNHWFVGFYPAENPRYTITILQDGIKEPKYSSAAIFSSVANCIHVIENG